ncbi:MAG TPA: hypothetical protein VFA80_18750 [Xanthobacteraceae bacterium]|nr:hypothetical protein [Xanthobacteraceae bacterium]
MAARVKNWKKFQHFKDRKPPWIKLYRDLLDDPDWHELSGDEAKALVMIWLVASENDGNLPDTRKLAFRLRIGEREVETLLKYLSHWLERDDIEAISFSEALESVGATEEKNSVPSDQEAIHAPSTDRTNENPDVPGAAREGSRCRPALELDGKLSDAGSESAVKSCQNAVRVTPGTPQWDAWLAHYASRNKLTHRLMSEAGDFNLHFLVPSEYPPSEA